VGLIYGDGINLKNAQEILERLKYKGFCSTNIVFGVGSYMLNYMTRDTLGFAMKATSVVVNGERKAIFKSPKTGSSKKSHKGLLFVDEKMNVHEDVTFNQEQSVENNLKEVSPWKI